MNRLAHLVGLVAPHKTKRDPTRVSDLRRYQVHRATAKDRGIPFEISFDEWLTWWKDSGHYQERGNKRGQYVMARIGDVGPYRLGNIECMQAQVNSVAAHLGKKHSAAVREKQRQGALRMHAKRGRLVECRSQEEYLRGAFHTMKTWRRWRGHQLWVLVGSITGHGSGYSQQICEELGWQYDMKITPTAALPPRVPK